MQRIMTKEEMKVETEEILKNFLKDTTQWDLITEEEMESRICTYQATGKTAELFQNIELSEVSAIILL